MPIPAWRKWQIVCSSNPQLKELFRGISEAFSQAILSEKFPRHWPQSYRPSLNGSSRHHRLDGKQAPFLSRLLHLSFFETPGAVAETAPQAIHPAIL